ncbi:flagellar export chaperone FlgN [Desulfocurvus sp. DL9XJH121]
MLDRITDNIRRQLKGLELLSTLLEEEFACLTGRDPQAVTGCEFSIQELLRQLAVERMTLKGMVKDVAPEARSLRDLEAVVAPEAAAEFSSLLDRVDPLEQRCAVQAEKNSRIAFALADQSRGLLEYMHKKIQPKCQDTYAKNGRFQDHRPEAAILRGRS